MLEELKNQGINWVDVENPGEKELSSLQNLGLDPYIIRDLESRSIRDGIEWYGDSIYVILHFPAIRHTHTPERVQEIDFVIKPGLLVTNHYEMIDPLHKFRKLFAMNSVLGHSSNSEHAGDLFYLIMRKLYKSVIHELEAIEDELNGIAKDIFSGHERAMVELISHVAIDLLFIENTLQPHRYVLKQYQGLAERMFPGQAHITTSSLLEEYQHVLSKMKAVRGLLMELRHTNDSLLTTKQNEISTNLTVMAFITFPLTALASIFGMNAKFMPFIGQPGDFWIILFLMATITFFLYLYFRFKRWL